MKTEGDTCKGLAFYLEHTSIELISDNIFIDAMSTASICTQLSQCNFGILQNLFQTHIKDETQGNSTWNMLHVL